MTILKTLATYRRMRQEPLWKLLTANNAAIIIGLLQTHLYEHEKVLPASQFLARINNDLELLRRNGEELPQSAQNYIKHWLDEGFLRRRLPTGAAEEEYELSASTMAVIRFLSTYEQPHATATESRLALVIDRLAHLAEETDSNQANRLARLFTEKERVEQEIIAIQHGELRVLSNVMALERSREIIALADELVGDFHRVRDEFDHLNRELRLRLLDHSTGRGEVLAEIFAGIDLISESEAGRTFGAFWRLLTDAEQAAALQDSLEIVLSRDFSLQLSQRERAFLRGLMRELLQQGGNVHDMQQQFARSLRHFVQSQEYLQQRRLQQRLNDAQRAAMQLKESYKSNEILNFTLTFSGGELDSVARWALCDPELHRVPPSMQEGEEALIDLTQISALLFKSEINFRHLKAQIKTLLQSHSQVSIGEVLTHFPATQGLGSIVGLIALGSQYGCACDQCENVSWIGSDNQPRRACITKIVFVKEQLNELDK